MRRCYRSNHPDERWRTLHEFKPVGRLTLAVCEPVLNPDTVNLVMFDTFEGVSVLAEIDRTSPGARARAISLGETIHDAMDIAAITWRIGDSGKQGAR